jgi:hypothetical protein
MQDRWKQEKNPKSERKRLPSDEAMVLNQPPLVHETIKQRYFLPPIYSDEVIFQPWLAASASVRFYNAKRNIDEVRTCKMRCHLDASFTEAKWSASEEFDFDLDSCGMTPPKGSFFCSLPPEINTSKNFKRYEKDFSDFLYYSQKLPLLTVSSLHMESHPGEAEADFMVRVGDRLREEKEAAIDKQVRKYNSQRQRIASKLKRAYAKLEKEQYDVSQRKTETLVSFGTAILGAFLGRKTVSATTISRTASGIKKAGRIAKEKEDVRNAEETAVGLEQELKMLEEEQAEKLRQLISEYEISRIETESFAIKPRRSDIFDVDVCLLWEMIPPPL